MLLLELGHLGGGGQGWVEVERYLEEGGVGGGSFFLGFADNFACHLDLLSLCLSLFSALGNFLLLNIFQLFHDFDILFILLLFKFNQIKHIINILDIALTKRLNSHKLKQIGNPNNPDQLLPHHGPIPIIHILREAQGILLLRIFLFDFLFQCGQNDIYSFG
jgi:hypothetical protein